MVNGKRNSKKGEVATTRVAAPSLQPAFGGLTLPPLRG
jgi:hypothetical protein